MDICNNVNEQTIQNITHGSLTGEGGGNTPFYENRKDITLISTNQQIM